MNPDPTRLEDRLEAALRAVTPRTDQELALDRVEQRRAARRRTVERRRRVRRTAASGTLAAACVVAVVVVATGRGEEVRTVGPAGTGRTASTAPPPDGTPDPVRQTDEGNLRGPSQPIDLPGGGTRAAALAGSPDGFWVTRGEPLDRVRSLPDTITFVARDGSVGPSTEVRGVALVAAADDEVLWVVVQETPDLDAPGALRLKRIDHSDGTLLASHDVPLGEVPVGLLATEDGVEVHGATRELVMDRRGAVRADRPSSGAPSSGQVVESGGLRWSLDHPGTDAASVDAGDAAWDRPGIRRLVPEPGTVHGDLLAEVLEGDRLLVVPLAASGSTIVAGAPVARLAASDSVATVDDGRLWVVRGHTVVSIPVDR